LPSWWKNRPQFREHCGAFSLMSLTYTSTALSVHCSCERFRTAQPTTLTGTVWYGQFSQR
jgi:hypothetical protein